MVQCTDQWRIISSTSDMAHKVVVEVMVLFNICNSVITTENLFINPCILEFLGGICPKTLYLMGRYH